jgi:hypothetical protein
MIHADTDPTGVVGQIVDAIGDRPAQFLDQEVVHPNVLRLTCGTPFPTGVLEVSDEFLLLRIDRDHRFARGQRRGHRVVDVNELRIAVGMAVAFPGLAIGLQAELLLSNSPTTVRPTRWPFAAKAAANCDRLLQVQRSGDIGSPRALGSTSASKSARRVASFFTSGLHPPPRRRTRPTSSVSALANSFRPRPIVLAAMPVAADTAAMPPYPAARASLAAHKRRSRSLRCRDSAAKRSRIGLETIIQIQ